MLAHKFDVARIKTWPVVVEPKLDGVRCLLTFTPDGNTALSRAGKPFTSVGAIQLEAARLFRAADLPGEWVLDGELFCGDFKTTVSQIKRKSVQAKDARFVVFDFYRTDITDDRSWMLRQQLLLQALRRVECKLIEHSKGALCHNEAAIMSQYEAFRLDGHEGAIVKTTDSLWSPRRSYAYMKLKASDTEDLKVIGAVEGEGKYVGTLGKIIVQRGTVRVGVGTGMDDDERDYLWRMWNLGALTGRTAEVGYHEVTPDGSLRHPVYRGLRIDK